MRVVTYDAGRGPRAGLLLGDRVADVWEALGGPPGGAPSVRALLEADRMEELGQLEDEAGEAAAVPLADARLLPPVPNPDKIVCLGLNYRSHAEEQGAEPPESLTFFAKFPNALVGPGAEVPLPKPARKVDYEAEVAFVVGRRAKEVPEKRAPEHLAGYMLLNDLSARDLQFATPQWTPGKVFDGSAPCGPALVTPGEAGPHDAIEFELTVNGETRQSASTADLFHSVPAVLSHLSNLMTLEPGDVVSTGTPAGVGSLRKPRVWLEPGDEIEIASPTLGTLETRIAAGGAAGPA